jgi:hypothetical protein
MRRTPAIAVAVLALAGCGGGRKADPVCANEAAYMAAQARQILSHYDSLLPADVAYLQFRDALRRFRKQGCDRRTVGQALQANITRAQFQKLLTELPRSIALYLRGSAGP